MERLLILPLLNSLGYEANDIEAKYPVEFQQGRRGRKPEADFVCFWGPLRNRDTSLLVVEAKRPGKTLPGAKKQGESYAEKLRAPLLLITNGETFEIWQLQTTQESACVLNISVSSLAAERGKVEQLLSKAAVYEYCKRFRVKTILEASADYGPYETAELKRASRHAPSISRTVRGAQDDPTRKKIETGRLLAECPVGAIIVAPSGYGKTTLCRNLLCQVIEERQRSSRLPLPFDTPAPDLEESELPIVEFMQRRFSAHCPGVTVDALRRLLRETGATVLCDGFDRATLDFRRKLNAELTNLLRDYPRVQLFVFSRDAARPSLGLPLFELEQLSDEQMYELERVVLDDGGPRYFSIIGMMSPTLRSLCVNPLLLELVLDYWRRNDDFPKKIELLFRSWLDSILRAEPSEHAPAAMRERALTIIAQATTEAPISGMRVVALLGDNNLPTSILDELIGHDAIRINGGVIEVQHEALADYLRAKAAAEIPQAPLLAQLSTLAMPADSFFPVLLMALLPTHRLQAALWKRLAEVSTDVYLDALRYRFDVSSELKQLDPVKLSEDYLGDLLEGIEIPLSGFFPELREAVAENLIGDRAATFAATGRVSAHPGALYYKLEARAPGAPRVIVGVARPPGTLRGVNLDLSRYRIDSARLLGMTLLRDQVLEAVRHQQLKGGPIWAAERLLGRVRYLKDAHGVDVSLTATLDALEGLLRPHSDEQIDDGAFLGRERFSVQSLLDDIAALRTAGVSELDPWWLRLGWNDSATLQDEEVIRRVLDEEYRRTQLVFAEIAKATFPKFAEKMAFFTSLPIRWKLDVLRRDRTMGTSTVWFRWMPVATWNEAGADVTFTDQGMPFPDPKEAREALARLNRPSDRFYRFGGFTQLSFYDGRQWSNKYDGATTVTHEVCSLLTEELKHIFGALPSGDGAF